MVTGSMVNGFAPSWARAGCEVLMPVPAVLPGKARPVAVPASRSAPSKLHGRTQRVTQRGPLPAPRTAVRLLLLLPPPPGAPHSCCSRTIAAAGTRGCDPRPLGLSPGPPRPGCSRPLLCSYGRDDFLRFSRRTLRSRSSSSSSQRALPGSPLRVRRRPQAFPPAGPTSCASLSASPGQGAGQSQRARVTKFQLPSRLKE